MRFDGIKFKNTFAYGNEMQEILFSKPGISLIEGINGGGKTTILRLLKIGVYFEYEKLPVSEVSNYVNGNGYIEVWGSTKNLKWKIISEYTETKIKNISVYLNGSNKAEDWGKIPETKEKIYEVIIDVPFSLFTNIVGLSLSDFKSFLSMNLTDSKNIRDKLFSFENLNQMYSYLTKEINLKNSSFEDSLKLIEIYNEQKQGYLDKIILIETESRKKIDEDKNLLSSEIKILQDNIKNNEEKISENNSEIESLKEKLDFVNNQLLLAELSSVKISFTEYLEEHKNLKINLDEKKSQKEKIHGLKLLHEKSKLFKQIQEYSLKKAEDEKLKKILEDEKTPLEEKLLKIVENNAKLNELKKEVESLEKFKILQEEDEKLKNLLKDRGLHLLSVENSLKEKKEEIDKISEFINKFISLQENNQRIIDLSESGLCPTCERDFNDENSLMLIEGLKEKNLAINESAIEKKKFFGALGKEIELLDSTKKTIEGEILLDKERIRIIGEQLKIYETLDKSKDPIILLENISVLEKSENVSEDELKKEIDDKKREILKYNTSIETLSDFIEKNKIEEKSEDLSKIEDLDYDSMIKKIESELGVVETDYNNLSIKLSGIKKDFDDKKLKIKENVKKFSFEEDLKGLPEKFNLQIKTISENSVLLLDQNNKNDPELKVKLYMLEVIEENFNSNISFLNKNISDLEIKISEIRDKDSKLINQTKFLKIVQYVLSEDGIKKYIMKNVVPFLNQNIISFLNHLHISLVCQFDEDFCLKIYRFGRESSTAGISLGQKRMIDCAIIFAFMQLLKMKYPDVNVVFYDEIFSGLHADNIPLIIEKVRSEIVEKMGSDVYIINHSNLSDSFFDRKITVNNDGTFSFLTIKNLSF